MSIEVFDTALEWIVATTPVDEKLALTFHGGEPLLAGLDWYQHALPRLRERFKGGLSLSLQSNLWMLTEEFCDLFKEYGVALGTSLDGPAEINDAQRGVGYFARTMAGLALARSYGFKVGVICTFTRLSAHRYLEVFDFFEGEGLAFSIHAMDQPLNGDANGSSTNDVLELTTIEHRELLVQLFTEYLERLPRLRISTFDQMASGLAAGTSGLCTFGDCLGKYLTIAPDGGIYSCNRLAGHADWRLGRVQEAPTLESLAQSPAWQNLEDRQKTVYQDCADCSHFAYCKGGCVYNVIVKSHRVDDLCDQRDPQCLAYRGLFNAIAERAMAEVFSEENMTEVVAAGPHSRYGLLRKGKLLQVIRGGTKPEQTAGRARETAAAVALAESATSEDALERLDHAGLVTRPEIALQSLTALRQRLDSQGKTGLLNAYVHVTQACNLACTHCYAEAGQSANEFMPPEQLATLTINLATAGFRKIIFTGGEPLLHPQRAAFLASLGAIRPTLGPVLLVLRTNLVLPLTPYLATQLWQVFDQIVVSVDGDEAVHDARRGPGTYARTTANLKHLVENRTGLRKGQLCLAAALTTEQITGPQGQAVRGLARQLGEHVEIRLRPVLPLGRGRDLNLSPTYYSSLDEEEDNLDLLTHSRGPTVTCGLGMNLYLDPQGECYPCYAVTSSQHALGNALVEGVAPVIARNDVYRWMTVDTEAQCRSCPVRYLCGGFCRAWQSGEADDEAYVDCAKSYQRAFRQLHSALRILEISPERWQAAGLSY